MTVNPMLSIMRDVQAPSDTARSGRRRKRSRLRSRLSAADFCNLSLGMSLNVFRKLADFTRHILCVDVAYPSITFHLPALNRIVVIE